MSWAQFSRLGEAQILLPAMLMAALWLARRAPGRPGALTWLLATTVAVGLTTASKVAFIGFEVGYAPWDYTGISGHTMFAFAILPVLLAAAAGRQVGARVAASAGLLLAAAVGVSRLKLGVHSVADVALGATLGLLVAGLSLRRLRRDGVAGGAVPAWLPAAMLAWLLVTPSVAPPSATHGWVTRLSLAMSGRPAPYTRTDMLRRWESQRAACGGASSCGSGCQASHHASGRSFTTRSALSCSVI
jgi:membrane-associated phospholipid phosphatase